MRISPARRAQRGNAVLEFALVCVFLAPLLLGAFAMGLTLERGIQATGISRDAGHMYARQVDFAEPANQDIILRLAQGLNMTRTGGNGVVILSRIVYISDDDCAAGGYPPGDARCANRKQHVFLQQITIGNAALRGSKFGTPSGATCDGRRNITDYLTNPDGRVKDFDSILTLRPGESAHVAEAFFLAPQLDVPGYRKGNAVYARTIF